MADRKFRYSLDNGTTWIEALKRDGVDYNIGSATGADTVIVEAIGAQAIAFPVLGLSAAQFAPGSAAGTVIGSVTGLAPGETVVSVVPNDGRLAINGAGTQLIVGLSASSAGTISATLTTSAGRTLTRDITVNAVTLPSVASLAVAFEAGYSGNTIDTLDQTFLPSDVSVASNKLALTGLKFNAFLSYNSASGTPVYFASSGTLPAPLQANTPYYLSPNAGGGYDIYPSGSASDYLTTPGSLAYETPLPAQNFAQLVNKITLTDTGSGTHRVYTDKLLFALVDRLGSGLTTEGRNGSSDRHSHMEVGSDAHGEFIKSRILAREFGANAGGTYALFGKSPFQGPGSMKAAGRNIAVGKRTVWFATTMRISPTQYRAMVKNIVSAANISTSTGVVTYTNANGKFATGNRVRLRVDPTGALPTGWAEGLDYYVYKLATNTFTLHTNATDAATGANPIIPTTQGSGVVTIYCPDRIGDRHRQQFFVEWLEPNQSTGANTLSPNAMWNGPTGAGLLTAAGFTTSGGTNGDILNLRNFALNGPTKIALVWAPGATRPVCQDTGADLADGDYWVTQYTGGGLYGRLHRTQAAALAAVGIGTGSLSNTQVIKFSSAGTGECLVNWNDGTTPFALNSTQQGSGSGYAQTAAVAGNPIDYVTRLPIGDIHRYIFFVDLNDTTKTAPIAKVYVDGVLLATYTLDGVQGLIGSTGTATNPAWTLFNSAASHVPMEGDAYGMYFGASTDAVSESDILAIDAYMKAKFAMAA